MVRSIVPAAPKPPVGPTRTFTPLTKTPPHHSTTHPHTFQRPSANPTPPTKKPKDLSTKAFDAHHKSVACRRRRTRNGKKALEEENARNIQVETATTIVSEANNVTPIAETEMVEHPLVCVTAQTTIIERVPPSSAYANDVPGDTQHHGYEDQPPVYELVDLTNQQPTEQHQNLEVQPPVCELVAPGNQQPVEWSMAEDYNNS